MSALVRFFSRHGLSRLLGHPHTGRGCPTPHPLCGASLCTFLLPSIGHVGGSGRTRAVSTKQLWHPPPRTCASQIHTFFLSTCKASRWPRHLQERLCSHSSRARDTAVGSNTYTCTVPSSHTALPCLPRAAPQTLATYTRRCLLHTLQLSHFPRTMWKG